DVRIGDRKEDDAGSDGHHCQEQEVAGKSFVPRVGTELLVEQAQPEQHHAEYGRMEVEGEQVAQASSSARTIIAIIGAKPDFVSPNVGQQDRDDAKGVDPNLLDWDRFLPALPKGIAPEGCPQRRRPIDESEEAQAK